MSEAKVWGVFGCPDFAYFQGVVFSSPDKARTWIDAQPDKERDGMPEYEARPLPLDPKP